MEPYSRFQERVPTQHTDAEAPSSLLPWEIGDINHLLCLPPEIAPIDFVAPCCVNCQEESVVAGLVIQSHTGL